MWILILAIVIVIVIIIIASVWWAYSSPAAPGVSEVGPWTPVETGTTAAVAAGAPADSKTLADVAAKTGTVPTVVVPGSTPAGTQTPAGVIPSGTNVSTTSTLPPLAPLESYTFVQGADMIGSDITHRADLSGKPAELATACDALSGCVAFNHLGYMKKQVYEPEKLPRLTDWTANPAAGLYYKNTVTFVPSGLPSTAVPAYTFAQGLDMFGYDLPAKTSLAGNVTGLAAACDADPQCVAFNTAGYLKKIVYNPLYLMPWRTTSTVDGLYYRPSKISPPSVLIFSNTSGTADATTVVLGVGTATLSATAKYIQIPRYVKVVLSLATTAGTKTKTISGFWRGAITEWAGATIAISLIVK
jgi:hypothetical protein